MKRIDLTLQNKRGFNIECSFFEHKNQETIKQTCVIYLNANGCSRLEAIQYLDVVLTNNMNLFCFDFSGSGKSEGNYCTLGFYEKEDLECAIDYLVNTKQVGKIGVWGRSMGAVTALLYSDKDPRINCLVIDSAFLSFKKLVKEVMKTKAHLPGFLMSGLFSILKNTINKKGKCDLDALCPIKHCSKIKIPALYGAGLDDTFVLPEHTKELYKTHLGPKELFLFEGDHNSQRPLIFMLAISDFLKQNLAGTIETSKICITNSLIVTNEIKIIPKNSNNQPILPPNPKFSIEQKDENDKCAISMTELMNEMISPIKNPHKSLKEINYIDTFAEKQNRFFSINTEHCASSPNIDILKPNRQRQSNSVNRNYSKTNNSRYIQSQPTSNHKMNVIFPIANLIPCSSFLNMNLTNETKTNNDKENYDDDDDNGFCNQLADVISCENLVKIPNKMQPRILAKQMKRPTEDNYGSTNYSQISTGMSPLETPKIYDDLINRAIFDEIKNNTTNELNIDTTREFKEGEHKSPKLTYCPFSKENRPFDRSLKKEPQLNQKKSNSDTKNLKYLLDNSLLITKETQSNILNSYGKSIPKTDKKIFSKNSTQITPISNEKTSITGNKSQSFIENNSFKFTNHRIIFDNISHQNEIKKAVPIHGKSLSNSFAKDLNLKVFNIKSSSTQDQKQLIKSVTVFKKKERDISMDQENFDRKPIQEEDYSTNSKSFIEMPNSLYTNLNMISSNNSTIKNALGYQNKSRFHIFDEKIINKYSK